MTTTTPSAVFLRDYKAPPYLIDRAELHFTLHPRRTKVRSRLHMRPNPNSADVEAPLDLDGQELELVSVMLDGKVLAAGDYILTAERLRLDEVPRQPFLLETEVLCNPSANTKLSGLYMSNGMYCTQCEAEGFRRITFFCDRPDVMTRFKVRMEAPHEAMPVLLSNGNPGATGLLPGTELHFAEWEDPFPKPSYLFALVAGDLASVHDTFTTRSGRVVQLGVHVEKGKEDRCGWAMESLKQAMRWDETAFGREYDLDVFNIVAVSNFNMGAMENKGLNIFNDKYVLALPQTATDTDYVNMEAIIAHEYFHNWTGNRITCRDWFQLCLKEGLTVFRDQEFCSDLRSRPVHRISEVKTLRARQFPEDGGPLAHPVRPSSYIEINNFYTPTVYEKGAEICRMMQTLVGPVAFRKAMDLYFQRHDGEAATVEDFVACMADASGRDLGQFFRWYEQAGTPQVVASSRYDPGTRIFELTLEQATPPSPGQPNKQPLHIPLGIGLLGPDGNDLPLDLDGRGVLNTPIIELTEARQTFRFRNVFQRPVLSLNRDFSAPVRLVTNATTADELFQIAHDCDHFNRWEAGQARSRALILAEVQGAVSQADIDAYAEALELLLVDDGIDPAFKALMIGQPPEAEIAAAIGKDVDTDAVATARDAIRAALGSRLEGSLQAAWRDTAENGTYAPDPKGTARRALRYAALSLLLLGNPDKGMALALDELRSPHSMTAEVGTLGALVQVDCEAREEALAAFYARHQGDALIIDKWFMLQAQAKDVDAAGRVRRLLSHGDFTYGTPNRVYALVGGFTGGNVAGFNSADGRGYELVADVVLALDPRNPQVAARIATGFRSTRILEAVRQDAAQRALRRILAAPHLSRDSYEIVSRIAQP